MLDPDLDPDGEINADTDPKHCRIHKGVNVVTWRHMVRSSEVFTSLVSLFNTSSTNIGMTCNKKSILQFSAGTTIIVISSTIKQITEELTDGTTIIAISATRK